MVDTLCITLILHNVHSAGGTTTQRNAYVTLSQLCSPIKKTPKETIKTSPGQALIQVFVNREVIMSPDQRHQLQTLTRLL